MLNQAIDAAGGAVEVISTLPSRVRAGEPSDWSLRVVAKQGLPAGTRLGIARRWPSDWGTPQWSDPDAPDYLVVTSSGGGRVGMRTQRQGDWHPFDHVLTLEIAEPLAGNGWLDLTFVGARVQTFVEERAPFSVRLQQPGDASWSEIASLATEVVGSVPHRLIATAPSIVAPNEIFALHVRAEDAWGNPASDTDLDLVVDAIGARGRVSSASGSWVAIPLALACTGVYRLCVRDADGRFVAGSNPIRCVEGSTRVFWGDIHAQSAIGCGAQTIEAYFGFARDFAAVDFASHQANCFLVSNPQWRKTQEVTARLNTDGKFVTLLGVEWSGSTDVGGDHNLYFPDDTATLRRCSHKHVADHSDIETDLPHVTDLQVHYRGTNTLMAVHVGGRTSNLAWHEPSTERLLEVHSTHATSEWFLFEALRRGYRLGVTGGSDGVDGRPGASNPGRMTVRNLRGGLTAVMMPRLTRAELWRALAARRTYATTGERILLSFEADGARFGDSVRSMGAPRFTIEVEGTAPLRSIELFRGTNCVFAAAIAAVDPTPSGEIRVTWRGASAPGNWEKARMVWDGYLEVSEGRILAARGWALDTTAEGIVAQTPTRIDWRSITAGDWDGLVLKLEEGFRAALSFVSAPIRCAFDLVDLTLGRVERRERDPARELVVERLPRVPASPSWAGTCQDMMAPPGEHAYWLRIVQEDGACAWSSPIYVTVVQ
jgi:Protein of unknown function (DUF3604)